MSLKKRKHTNSGEYIYLSFDDADNPRVYFYINAIKRAGYRVKFDRSGNAWSDRNAKEIAASQAYIVFFSSRCARASKIKSEMNFAATCNVPFFSVHLDAVPITSSNRRIFDGGDAIMAYNMNAKDACNELILTLDDTLRVKKGKSPVFKALAAAVFIAVVIMISGMIGLFIVNDKFSYTKEKTVTIVSNDYINPIVSEQEILNNTSSEKEIKPILNICSVFGQGDTAADSYAEMLSDFNEQNPQIVIKDQSTANYDSYKTYLTDAFRAGEEPDVFVLHYDMLNTDMAVFKRKIVDTETIEGKYPEYTKGIYDFALENVRDYDTNKIYAAPIRGYWEGLYCNYDLFEANNLEIPSDWEKFSTAVDAFAQSEITPIAASLGKIPQYLTDHLILSAAGTADFNIRPEKYEDVPNSWISGLDLFRTLLDHGAFPSNTMTIQDNDLNTAFTLKKAAMKVDGSWFCTSLMKTKNVTVIPFPTAPGGKKQPQDIIGGYSIGWGISQKAWDDPQKREICVKLIEYMYKPENLIEFCKDGGAPPAKVAMPESSPQLIKDGVLMIDNISNSKNLTISKPLEETVSKEKMLKIYASIPELINGGLDSQQVLNRAFS